MKDAQVDEAIAKQIAKAGSHLEEGGCESTGFKKEMKHEVHKGFTISVW